MDNANDPSGSDDLSADRPAATDARFAYPVMRSLPRYLHGWRSWGPVVRWSKTLPKLLAPAIGPQPTPLVSTYQSMSRRY